MANRGLAAVGRICQLKKFYTRMSEEQPTFIQRIRLLECLVHEIRNASCQDFETHAWADVIEAEVERMKAANVRFEAQREKRKAKTAS